MRKVRERAPRGVIGLIRQGWGVDRVSSDQGFLDRGAIGQGSGTTKFPGKKGKTLKTKGLPCKNKNKGIQIITRKEDEGGLRLPDFSFADARSQGHCATKTATANGGQNASITLTAVIVLL